MVGRIDAVLAELGETLPDAPAPAANYVPYVIVGDLVFVSGQVSKGTDGLICGKLGDDMDVAAGQAAAKVCALNLIAQVKAACGGDLDRVTRVVKLGGFVNCTPDFGDHPAVINGASDFMGAVFGDAGAHARAAVGSSSLPFGVAVEIEGIFQIS
ncbi:RidA family protein [Roseobacter sp. N2S]|uniref:RidA family protein n=1 Tax=Roseobacter sp. N2S TaxID=2663844 RepID=UPI002862E2E1|nr:RidA family protein [Roseobacter sp. N2S]MDR6263576.1 enamine deaminase RidA (YjgF/YER057c/UK114 family) [Roseobacter sp. N2S]